MVGRLVGPCQNKKLNHLTEAYYCLQVWGCSIVSQEPLGAKNYYAILMGLGVIKNIFVILFPPYLLSSNSFCQIDYIYMNILRNDG